MVFSECQRIEYYIGLKQAEILINWLLNIISSRRVMCCKDKGVEVCDPGLF